MTAGMRKLARTDWHAHAATSTPSPPPTVCRVQDASPQYAKSTEQLNGRLPTPRSAAMSETRSRSGWTSMRSSRSARAALGRGDGAGIGAAVGAPDSGVGAGAVGGAVGAGAGADDGAVGARGRCGGGGAGLEPSCQSAGHVGSGVGRGVGVESAARSEATAARPEPSMRCQLMGTLRTSLDATASAPKKINTKKGARLAMVPGRSGDRSADAIGSVPGRSGDRS